MERLERAASLFAIINPVASNHSKAAVERVRQMDESMPKVKVIWLKPVLGRYGKTIQRIEATLIAVGEDWCTVELSGGEQCSVKTRELQLAKAART